MSDNSSSLYFLNVTRVADCETMMVIGIYSCVLMVLSLISNSILILAYYLKKELQTPMNFLQVTLAIVNLIGTIIEMPPVILNAFSCQFVIGYFGCVIIGFVMYFVGCMGIYLVMLLSFERYWIMRKVSSSPLSFKVCYIGIGLSAILSLFWSILPIFGWSRYVIEGVKVSCSIDWVTRTANVISYNVTIFLTTFIIPIVVLVITNFKLILIMEHSQQKLVKAHAISTTQFNKRREKERHMAVITLYQISFFMLSWTPYSFISMYSAFIDSTGVTPIYATIPALFAKSSILWPALWTIIVNKDFRKNPFHHSNKVFNEHSIINVQHH